MSARWDPLAVIVDMVTQVADTPDEPDARVEVIIDILRGALDARVGLLLRADLTHVDVQFAGSALTPPLAAGLRHALRMRRLSDPLLDPIAAGDLAPSTAERAFGRHAWTEHPTRSAYLEAWGCDQVASLPVTGGEHFVTFLLVRRGADFSEEDLALLQQVQPVVAVLGRLLHHVQPGTPVADPPVRRISLTGREEEVLQLLARGHKAATIGRMAGCSERTVHRHLSSIYAKLGVRDRLSAVRRGHELGLLNDEELLSG